MVEAAALGLDNSVLLDNLSYKLGQGAAYVQERKSVPFYASGSNSYSPNGTKVIKLVLTGDSWLDPSTFRVMFTVNNKSDAYNELLRPLGDGHSFFSRMRILMGSTVVEDIQDYNRLHQMFNLLISKNSKVNLAAEGFGLPAYDYKTSAAATSPVVELTDTATRLGWPGISGGGSQTILFTPLSGIFAQSKYIPLRYSPIILELELCSKFDDPFVSINNPFKIADTSNEWDLSNVQAKCDVLILDSELENGYTQLLMSGKHLTFNYSTYIHQYQSIAGQPKTRLNVARSLSRLKSVFVTFDKTDLISPVYKKFNSFYSPMFNDDKALILVGDANEIEFSVTLGSKMYPEQPIRSHSEAYYQLRKTLGVQSSALHSFDISAQEYKRRSFVLGIDTETILHATMTGHNTRSGELLNIQFDQSGNAASRPTDMYIVLCSDNLIEISDSGVRCYD